MPGGHDDRYDFLLSRRGSVASTAREVADVLTEEGYRVLVQDYDIPLGASFIEAMHEAVKNSRDLIVLYTEDYEQSPYTRKEFTSFEAERALSTEERHIIVMRCEDVPLRGLLADNVYQDLVSVEDPEERKRRIIAAAERQSQAAPPPLRPFIGVPPRIASFTGRAEGLDKLDAILIHDKPAAVTQSIGRAAVQGMGGVGKTSLAVEYAHRYRKLYAGVCWCPAETRTGLLSALAALAVTLGATTTDDADVEKAAKTALRRLDEQRATWLVVYDNVAGPDEIDDLLPSGGARVLITSRFSDWSAIADEVALDVLSTQEAVAFLQTRAGRSDADGARTLAKALGCLPLALDHAAAYCKRTQMPFAEYAAKAEELITSAPRGAGYPRSVSATFDLAITEAAAQCPTAETLMAFLAQCAPERIPTMLLRIENEAKYLDGLAALVEMSLVKHDPFEDRTPAIMVHRLVQAAAKTRAEAKEAIEDLLMRLADVYPQDAFGDHQTWPWCAKITPHLLALWTAGKCTGTLSADLLSRAGHYFAGRASYLEAEPLLRDALIIREKLLGAEHPDTAESLNDLACLLTQQGNLAAARPLHERALVIREHVLGPEHPDTAESLGNLDFLLQEQGDLPGARSLSERALAISEKTLGVEHPLTALRLNNLGVLLKEQGDAGARALYERALAIREKVLGRDHPDTAQTLNNLAILVWQLGDGAKARALQERALAIHESACGPEHPATVTDLSNLAYFAEKEGSLAEAKSLQERALNVREKTLGPDHPMTNVSRRKLSQILLTSGEPSSAMSHIRTALAAHETVLGQDHNWTKDSARVTADALDALGRADEAKELRERYGL